MYFSALWLTVSWLAKRRFFAVLHQPPIDSAQGVVRAAIVAENRKK
jgi:hypothetical protein